MLDVFLHFYIRPLRDFFFLFFSIQWPLHGRFSSSHTAGVGPAVVHQLYITIIRPSLTKKKHKILSSVLLTLMAKIHAAYGTCLILLLGRTCDVDGPWHTCGNNEPLLGTAQLIKIWASLFYPFFYCIIRRRELPVALHFTLSAPHLRKNKISSLFLLFL